MADITIVFMGTPEFAIYPLQVLVEKGYKVEAVVTQPDRPVGRGKKVKHSPVKEYALKNNLKLLQPEKASQKDFHDRLKKICPDIVVTAAFGQLLPQTILDIPSKGCINIHASLLPKLRGAAPIHRAIMNGEEKTGITTFLMNKGMDTGDILLMKELAIKPLETTGELYLRLAKLSEKVIVETIEKIITKEITPTPQNHAEATYAPPLTREEEKINWHESAWQVLNKIHGLNPMPGAYSLLNGKRLKLWRAQVSADEKGKVGEITGVLNNQGIVVRCGQNSVILKEVQPAGKKRISAEDFVRGYDIQEAFFQ